MEISEIRIKLMNDPGDRLQAFCSITFNGCFVIRDLKIIQGIKGSFVAMPSRKLTDRCPRCSSKNHLRAHYCSDCGARLHPDRAVKDNDGRAKLYADIAHPINSECRELIQRRVVQAYLEELEKSRLPGYVCTYDDYGEESYAALLEGEESHELQPVMPVDAMRHYRGNTSTINVPVGAGRVSVPNRGQAAKDEEGFGTGLV